MRSMLLVSLLLALTPNPAAAQARDTPPPVIENARRERELRATIAAGMATPEVYAELAALLNRQSRFDEVIEALRGAAALEPANPEPQHRLAVFFWDKVRGEVDAAKKASYLRQGLEAEDRALSLKPDYMEAMTYKNILLRLQASASTDPVEQKRLLEEADALRARVIAMQNDRQPPRPRLPGPRPPEPPAPPFAGFAEPYDQALARLQPVRVGGNIRMPAKVRDVKPAFPAEAQAARIQGVVIIEALVDETGTVANARVLRSIPQLDAAALGAVSQWQFTPTEVDGRRVPVVLTVTVNFTLMQ